MKYTIKFSNAPTDQTIMVKRSSKVHHYIFDKCIFMYIFMSFLSTNTEGSLAHTHTHTYRAKSHPRPFHIEINLY